MGLKKEKVVDKMQDTKIQCKPDNMQRKPEMQEELYTNICCICQEGNNVKLLGCKNGEKKIKCSTANPVCLRCFIKWGFRSCPCCRDDQFNNIDQWITSALEKIVKFGFSIIDLSPSELIQRVVTAILNQIKDSRQSKIYLLVAKKDLMMNFIQSCLEHQTMELSSLISISNLHTVMYLISTNDNRQDMIEDFTASYIKILKQNQYPFFATQSNMIFHIMRSLVAKSRFDRRLFMEVKWFCIHYLEQQILNTKYEAWVSAKFYDIQIMRDLFYTIYYTLNEIKLNIAFSSEEENRKLLQLLVKALPVIRFKSLTNTKKNQFIHPFFLLFRNLICDKEVLHREFGYMMRLKEYSIPILLQNQVINELKMILMNLLNNNQYFPASGIEMIFRILNGLRGNQSFLFSFDYKEWSRIVMAAVYHASRIEDVDLLCHILSFIVATDNKEIRAAMFIKLAELNIDRYLLMTFMAFLKDFKAMIQKINHLAWFDFILFLCNRFVKVQYLQDAYKTKVLQAYKNVMICEKSFIETKKSMKFQRMIECLHKFMKQFE